jgi:hypothetical protein
VAPPAAPKVKKEKKEKKVSKAKKGKKVCACILDLYFRALLMPAHLHLHVGER